MLFLKWLVSGKCPNDASQLFEILSSFLQAFDILLKLAGLDDRLHLLPAVNQGIRTFETLKITPRSGVLQSLFCFFIWDFHRKGKAISQSDLGIKHTNGLGRAHSKAV